MYTIKFVGGPLDGKERIESLCGPYWEHVELIARKPLAPLDENSVMCYFDEVGYPVMPRTRMRRFYRYDWTAIDEATNTLTASYTGFRDDPLVTPRDAPGEWIYAKQESE